jgi:hypothetical protein
MIHLQGTSINPVQDVMQKLVIFISFIIMNFVVVSQSLS